MSYYFSKMLNTSFDEAIEKVNQSLKQQGFGILAEIDVQSTLKKKLDVEMPAYKILGACHPSFAYQALQLENKVGTMLPCNVTVQQKLEGVEVAAVDPVASMQAIDNINLQCLADQVRAKLKATIEDL